MKVNSVIRLLAAVLLAGFVATSMASVVQSKGDFVDKFRQLDESLPTPNEVRTAAGEPGPDYWQQKVDYRIRARLDEPKRRLEASQTVTYHNRSPYTLKYLWLQLDQNIFRPDSLASRSNVFGESGDRNPATRAKTPELAAGISLGELRRQQWLADNEVGYELSAPKDAQGRALANTVVGTNWRIDLIEPLAPGQSMQFSLDYAFNIVDEDALSARSGYEHFPDDPRPGGNDIFLLAQWFPRLHAFTDYEAWTNKEFLGRGEFTLEFGDYDVSLDVPADHIVSSTGVLGNPDQVLSALQRQRLQQARSAKRPVSIVTEAEAMEAEKQASRERKVWQFSAKNVRDFAWASSRKFMWDAKLHRQDDAEVPEVWAMSFYPKEGGELWRKYSTEAVVHTMEVYSRFAFNYPYPVAQSVNGPVGGMEYPMITFNGPRTKLQKDGSRTWTLNEKRFLIGVVIHEIGHIYFPMVVNSDERQWTWMDEGLNSFLDGVAGREWDPKIPWGVEPRDIVGYMASDVQMPIMTQSDSVLQLGPNAYAKPAVALNILREVILGRELFDFAFREFSLRWKFKRPTPADFFRTMEEASGVDLDWFWHGWFYTTDHVDISLERVWKLRLDTRNPDIDFDRRRNEEADKPQPLFELREREAGAETWVERNPDVRDFYDANDRFTVTEKERNEYRQLLEDLEPWERAALERAVKEDKHYYVMQFDNLGGLVMPILLDLEYADGSRERMTLPAEIWRRYPRSVAKLIVTDKELVQVVVDPHWETADVDVENNHYPRRFVKSRIEAYKEEKKPDPALRDIMQDSKTKPEKPKPGFHEK